MAFGRKSSVPPGTGIEPAAAAAAPAVPAVADGDGGQVAIPDHLLEQIITAVQKIPEAADSDQFGIIAQLLQAKTFGDLNKPWESTPGRALAGRRLRITSVTRRPSEFDGGPEIFLIVQATDLGTGEQVTFTTSALAVIVQLAAAVNSDWLPLTADVAAAKKPTKRGYTPYHLNITSVRDGAS